MWNIQTMDEFRRCISDLIAQPDVQDMDHICQHAGGVSCLDHCVFVSYLSFALCRRWGLDYVAAARAGLLHDLYLCDWSATTIGPWERLLIHPQMALHNAEIHGLSELEKDIISNHMWPITLRRIPRHRESAVVNLADKLCATAEMLRIYRLIGAGRRLVEYNFGKRRLIPDAVV
ncbi:MAG: HD family phosphohydrolase [Oscillospiraceae bacterium]